MKPTSDQRFAAYRAAAWAIVNHTNAIDRWRKNPTLVNAIRCRLAWWTLVVRVRRSNKLNKWSRA